MKTWTPSSAQDVESVAELARRYGVYLRRFAYLLCGDPYLAEDLLQEVLLAMHRRFPGELSLENPLGYARRALANANVSPDAPAFQPEIILDTVPETSAPGNDSPDHDELWQALRRLPPRQRTVVVLRYYADATDGDIAAALGCPSGTVRSLVSRALAALRDDPNLDRGAAR